MAEKFCIFCGKKPENKNLEHVIPQWLIKMTGRENKDVFTDFPEDHKHLNFMNFKFPACTKCNTKYAYLEKQVKPIMVAVLDGKPISGAQASLLMDWFDKVRIGLWLAEMYFDPELKANIQPHFFIDSRTAKTDRMLSIQRVNMPGKGIYFIGTNSAMFTFSPSAFTMLINDMFFINASNHNLVSPKLGFPVLARTKFIDPFLGKVTYSVHSGRHKVTNPIITDFIPNPNSVTFYQPIMKEYVNEPIILNDNYVLKHCYDINVGLGGVFVQQGNTGNIRYLSETDKTSTKTKIVNTDIDNMVMNTLKIQKIVHDKSLVKTFETKSISHEYGVLLDNYAKKSR